MRNLKRALSLTLASVMLLGMMVLGTSAASYPDVTDEHNVEAIGVLQAVGVMSGSNNGNFNPDAKISRIEMAIVMANLLDLDVDYFQGQNTFSDVPAWASGYVNACAAHGIVSGVGGGRFGTGNVTATQAALMMLKALGYFQYNSDFGGDWARATALQASRIRLFDGINAQDNTQLDRNQVAQLALNALKADMVDPDASGKLDITTPDGTTVSNGNVNYVVRTTNAAFATAIDDEVSGGSIDGRNGNIIQLGEQLYNGELKQADDDVDDFGRPSVTWTYKNDKIGTFADKTELVATYTTKVSKGDIYGLLSSSVRSALEATQTGDGADKVGKLTVTVDGQADGSNGSFAKANVSTPSAWYVRNSSEAIYTPVADSTRRGTLTEVYVDNDNNVDIVIVNTYVYQATSDYSATRDDVKMAAVGDTALNLKGGELTLKGEDFNIVDVKTDDYLLITAASKNGANYEVQSVKVAEKVTGTVNGYTTNDSVTIGDTTYNYSATTLKTGGASNVRATTYTVGQDAIVVLDNYGNIIAVDEAVSSSSFVFIKDFGSTSGLTTKVLADAYFTDGTNEEITIDRVDSTKSASTLLAGAVSGKKAINTWYTYSVNSDGKYVLYSLTNRTNKHGAYTSAADNTQIVYNGRVDFMKASPNGIGTQGNPGYVSAGSAGIANDKTIMIVKDKEGDVTPYTGTANIPDIKLNNGVSATLYYVQGSKGYAEYAFIDLENKDVTIVDGGDDTSFLYVLRNGDAINGANGTNYYTYSTINPETGKDEKVSFDIQYFGATHPYGLYYKPRYNSSDRITSLTAVPNEGGSGKYFNHAIGGDGMIKFGDGSLKIGNANFIVASDNSSKITLVIRKDASTKPLLGNEDANHEIYFETQAQTVASLLKDYKVTGTIAGATKSSTSSVIDTLYITVTHVGPGTPSTSTDINDALTDPDSGAAVEFENVNLGSSTTNVPTGKNLVLSGDVAGDATVSATGTGKVELKNAEVQGNLTVTAPATLSGAVSVAAGKTLAVADVTLANNSTVTLPATGTMNITGAVTAGTDASITGEEGATLVVGPTADAAALLTVAKFFIDGVEVEDAEVLKGKTFTWKDAWTDPVRAARASHNAGWYAESGNEGGDTYTIAVPTLSAAVTGYSIAADKTTAAAGDTVTVTITAASTCAAATGMTVAVTPTTTVIAPQGVTNAANTAGTFAFTFTMPAANVTAITGTVSTGSGEPETHTHVWSEFALSSGEHVRTCTGTGTCNATDADKAHTPSAGSDWSKDNDNHWHVCSVEGCNVKMDEAAHTWDAGTEKTAATCEGNQVKTFTCTVEGCAQTKDEETANTATGHSFKADENNQNHVCENDPSHTHAVPTTNDEKVEGCTVCDGLSL